VIRRFDHSLAGLALLALVAAFTVELFAHLAVARTMPAHESTVTDAPARVQIWFTQQPSPRVSLLEMKGPRGDVPLGEIEISREERAVAAAVNGALAPGRYVVSWRTAGDDGHVMRGTFTFSLKTTE